MNEADFPYPWKKCQEGSNLCYENAKQLLLDATILCEDERYTSSAFLAVITLEEIGKGLELYELVRTKTNLSKTRWEKLTQHIRKIKTGRDLAYKNMKETLSKYKITFKTKPTEESQKILAEHYQWAKEQNLYVGLDNNEWTAPSNWFPTRKQGILASFRLTEAYEACIGLAKLLGKDVAELERNYEAFKILQGKI
jgi:AbiV family abortive infection protein